MTLKIDYVLQFLQVITKSDLLHWGYWEANDTVEWRNLGQAQERYTEKVLAKIPKEVKTILDVGCGTGQVAALLQSRGYDVEGVTPDLALKEKIKSKYGTTIKIHPAKFEYLNISKTFDLILLMESLQYLRLDQTLQNCQRYLKPNGAILISDTFRLRHTKDYKDWHIIDAFAQKSDQYGFKIITKEDITLNTAPTIDLVSKLHHDYVLPLSEILRDGLRKRMRTKMRFILLGRVIHFLFKKNINEFNNALYHHFPQVLNRENFLAHGRYMIYLLKSGNRSLSRMALP